MLTLFIVSGLAFLACAYLRLALWAWVVVFFAVLTGIHFLPGTDLLTRILMWGIFVLVFTPLLLVPLRKKLISAPAFRYYNQQLPPMSDTERDALEVGTVWWDAELFSGKPDWRKLTTLPAPALTQEEQAFLDGPVETLCEQLDDWAINRHYNDLPEHVWQYLREQKFFAMIIPKSYGGLGFSALAHSAVVMKLATRSITAAVTAMVPNSLGPGMLLMQYGTEAQKDHYLPRLADGTEIPCFALTAPDAGSDAGGMTDYGVVCTGEYNGKPDVPGIRLTWEKRYITLAPVATLLGLAFKLYDPDHLLGEDESLGITLALIPTDHPGVNTGRRHRPGNVPFQNGPTNGKDVFIPMDWIIGGQENIGRGWHMLMECLADGRGISLPALSTGAGKFLSRTTGAYARSRRQFHVAIGDFQGIQEPLARIAGLTYQMDAARKLMLTALDTGEKPAVISAIVKYHLTESMRQVVNDAMDIHGGKAIMQGPRNYLSGVYQAVPIGITVEGANILTRNMIIFGQGAVRCHPYLRQEMQAASLDDATGLTTFDKALFGHLGFVISNLVRTILLGVGNGHLHRPPVRGPARRYYQHLMRLSAAFALLVDSSLLILGGSLKRREYLSARLGDMLSQLYLLSAVLKQYQDNDQPDEEKDLLEWCGQTALYRWQTACSGFLQNFPARPVAWLLRVLVFPLGRSYRKPADHLTSGVAGLLLAPSDLRDRLTNGMYLPNAIQEPVAQLDLLLDKMIAIEPLLKKIKTVEFSQAFHSNHIADVVSEAVSREIIDTDEGDQILDAMQLYDEVIAVDDFEPVPSQSEEMLWPAEKAAPSI